MNTKPIPALWTKEQISDLIAMDSRGLTAKFISEYLNGRYGTRFTKSAVIGKPDRIARAEAKG